MMQRLSLRPAFVALTTALTFTVGLACGSSDEAPPAPRTATSPPPVEPAAPVPAPKPPAPAPTPAPTPTPTPPPAATPTPPAEPAAAPTGDPAAGQAQYVIYCGTCHGTTGNGEGPLSATLDPKPAVHTDGNYMNALSDDHLFKVIKEGGMAVGKSPLMAGWGGTLSDEQIRDVIAFLRSIAKPPYPGA